MADIKCFPLNNFMQPSFILANLQPKVTAVLQIGRHLIPSGQILFNLARSSTTYELNAAQRISIILGSHGAFQLSRKWIDMAGFKVWTNGCLEQEDIHIPSCLLCQRRPKGLFTTISVPCHLQPFCLAGTSINRSRHSCIADVSRRWQISELSEGQTAQGKSIT